MIKTKTYKTLQKFLITLGFENIENSGSIILAMGFKKVIIAPNIGVIPDRLNNQKKFRMCRMLL